MSILTLTNLTPSVLILTLLKLTPLVQFLTLSKLTNPVSILTMYLIFCQYQHIQYQFMVISRSSLINILLAQLSGKNLLCTFHKYKFIMFVSGLGHTTFVYSYQESAKFHTFKCDKSWMSQLFNYIWKGNKSKIQK